MKYDIIPGSRNLARAEWLALRRTGIGGSDAAAVMGVSPFRGPFSVWAEKVGCDPGDDTDSEAMRQGRDLEEYVTRRFAEKTGLRLRREGGMMRSREHPFMIADIDRRIAGRAWGLECKTSRDIHLTRYRNGEFPLAYHLQVCHYLAVTGWERWFLAVLVYGTDLLIFEINRAEVEDDIAALVAAEEAFWKNYVEAGQAPPPDGLESTGAALLRMYPRADETGLEAEAEDEERMAALLALKVERKALDRRISEAENTIKARMGGAEALNGVAARATWRAQTRRTISEDKLRELYPEIDLDSIRTETTARVFKVRGAEEE